MFASSKGHACVLDDLPQLNPCGCTRHDLGDRDRRAVLLGSGAGDVADKVVPADAGRIEDDTVAHGRQQRVGDLEVDRDLLVVCREDDGSNTYSRPRCTT